MAGLQSRIPNILLIGLSTLMLCMPLRGLSSRSSGSPLVTSGCDDDHFMLRDRDVVPTILRSAASPRTFTRAELLSERQERSCFTFLCYYLWNSVLCAHRVSSICEAENIDISFVWAPMRCSFNWREFCDSKFLAKNVVQSNVLAETRGRQSSAPCKRTP